MGQTLTHGIYLPDEGERNCYSGLAANWQLLDGAVGTVAEHTTALAGKAPLVHTHTKSDVTDLFNSANTWTGVNIYTGNTTIDKNSANPTTPDETALAFIAGSNYIFFRTKGSSNFKSYNSFLWGGHQGSGYSGENRFGHLKIYRASDIYGESGENTPDTSFSFLDIALHYKKVGITDNVSFKNDGTINACYPAYNNATDLGFSTNQWNNLYAKNYYYNGTAWGLDKANVWTGDNTFSNTLNVQTGYTLGTLPQAESAVTLFTGRTTDNNFATSINFYQNPTKGTGLRFTIRNKWDNNGYSTTGTTRNAHFELLQSINKTAYMQWEGYVNNGLYPLANNAYDLGASTNKWKSLNGINPGALSLPNYNASIAQDISGDMVPDQDGRNIRFTPTMNGWMYVDFNISNATLLSGSQEMLVQVKDSSIANANFAVNFAASIGSSHIFVYLPVLKERLVILEINFTGFSIGKGYVYPCIGNV